jgi:Leucine-rich repeat (LRR) protein
MRDTQRTLNNIHGSMDSLTNLTELDLAQNALPKVPEALYCLRNLRRLNLSDNEMTELSQAIGKCCSYRDLLNLDIYIYIWLIIKNNIFDVFTTKGLKMHLLALLVSLCIRTRELLI